MYANAVHDRGAALGSCWGFVDGTVREMSRPNEFQRILYNRHKKVHALKFQSVVAPNGFIAKLYGLVEGNCHDSGMLRMSGLLKQLQVHSFDRESISYVNTGIQHIHYGLTCKHYSEEII